LPIDFFSVTDIVNGYCPGYGIDVINYPVIPNAQAVNPFGAFYFQVLCREGIMGQRLNGINYPVDLFGVDLTQVFFSRVFPTDFK
jgi:hypothetical protein